MRTVAIIQARLGSTRLPAKIMLDLGGKTALERCLERVSRFRGLSEIVLATTREAQDDLVVALAKRLDVRIYRGDEKDVLRRYVEAAREAQADIVVRCTSDCPLLDPEISSKVIETFLNRHVSMDPVDYASNNLERYLPLGLDTEVFSMSALEKANRIADDASEREHVTIAMYRRPEEFRCIPVRLNELGDLSGHRWTLDTLADYHFLASVFNKLGASADMASMKDVLRAAN